MYMNYSPARDVSQKYLEGPQQAPGTRAAPCLAFYT